MNTVTVDKTGKVELPNDIWQTSHIKPGTELVVIAVSGKITLMDRKQVSLRSLSLQERMKTVDHEMRARLRKALEEGGEESFFAGLNLSEYLALSEDEEKTLWEHLLKEAEREVKTVEQEIPPHFRPAGQRYGTRNASRRRSD